MEGLLVMVCLGMEVLKQGTNALFYAYAIVVCQCTPTNCVEVHIVS